MHPSLWFHQATDFPAPRRRGAHSASRQTYAKARRHDLKHALCRRCHMFRTRRASPKRLHGVLAGRREGRVSD